MPDLQILRQALTQQDGWFRSCVVFEHDTHNPQGFPQSSEIIEPTELYALGEAAMGTVLEGQERLEAREHRDEEGVIGETAIFPSDSAAAIDNSITTLRQPTMEQAAKALGMGLEDGKPILDLRPTGPRTCLQPWQAIGIQWMMGQESNVFPGGILADGCGLGKTFQILCLIYYQAEAEAKMKPTGPFHPSLIIVPPSLLETSWYPEIETRFGNALHLRVFYGDSRTTSNQSGKEALLTNLTDLTEWYDSLDFASVRTAKTIVLTSYETWARRTTRQVTNKVRNHNDLQLQLKFHELIRSRNCKP